METIEEVNELEVVIHRTHWETAEGHVCLKWPAYWVAVGKNPRGPRGGVNGKVMDGTFVGGRFSSYQDAEIYANYLKKRLAAGEIIANVRGGHTAMLPFRL